MELYLFPQINDKIEFDSNTGILFVPSNNDRIDFIPMLFTFTLPLKSFRTFITSYKCNKKKKNRCDENTEISTSSVAL